MITWTDSARAALENHNQRVRQGLQASGADPDEVAADLRRHIEEELTAAQIHLATRDEVQRVLGRMGASGLEPAALPAKSRSGIVIAAGAVLVMALVAVAGFLYLRPVDRDSTRYPPQWLVPTSQDPAELTLPIGLFTHTPDWGPFQAGDSIVVSSVRGNRKGFEVGGRYLIEGDYTLASMEAARLSVSVTALRGGIGGRSPGHPEEATLAHRGKGHFAVIATMRYPGHFHVTFNPLEGGQSRGTVYFDQLDPLATQTALVIEIGGDGRISVNGAERSDSQFESLLTQAHADPADRSVTIKSDERANLKRLSFVMDACREAGISRFALQAR